MIKDIIVSLLSDMRQDCRQNWYMKWFYSIVLIALVGGGGWKLYRSHVISKENKAQVAFSSALDEYHHLVYSSAPANDSRWEDAATHFKMVAQKHSGTVYGDFAQAFLADVDFHQDKLEESILLFEQWLTKNSEKNPLYYLYKTRLALVCFDSNQTEKAISMLQELSVNSKNKYQDMAQFFLGYYYWSQDDLAQAQKVWQTLIDANAQVAPEGRSPWASIVESKLRYIPSK